MKRKRVSLLAGLSLAAAISAPAADFLVPEQYVLIQGALDEASPGDRVLVAPGTYAERIFMKPGVTLRSRGDDTKGKLGLKRAEATILSHPEGKGPGVTMAEGAVLDGFTITGVGRYDEDQWREHNVTQGNFQKHDHIGAPGTPGIAVNHTCEVRANVVRHIGYSGIAITGTKGRNVSPLVIGNVCHRNMGGGIGSMNGSTGRIEKNICFENFYAGIGMEGASPTVRQNECFRNVRAGIGISEGSSPKVFENRCFANRRAGIGIRTGRNTRPTVEGNLCFENHMAGIGAKEEARPFIKNNRCIGNKLAGIGCWEKAEAEITGNHCEGNGAAGIGLDRASAILRNNVCVKNKSSGLGMRNGAEATAEDNQFLGNALVAVGVRNDSTLVAKGNHLERAGGMPPLMAALEQSRVTLNGNQFVGGGVAGLLLQGTASLEGNEFLGSGPRKGGPPNFGVWVRAGSALAFTGNQVSGWRHAIHAEGAKVVTATSNSIRRFHGAALVVRNTGIPPEIKGNRAYSDVPEAKVLQVVGPPGQVTDNQLLPSKK